MVRSIIQQSLWVFFLFVLTLSAKGQTVQLGSGTNVTGTTSASPVNIYYRSMHMQIVYTAAELNAAGIHSGSLNSLGFYIENSPSHNLPNFRIGVKHTSAVSSATNIVGPYKEVYRNPSYAPAAGGFDMISLDSVFKWNGTDNIALDICFERVPNYTSTGRVRYYNDGNSVGYVRSDGSDQCSVNIGTTTTNKPQIQMNFLPDLSNNVAITGANIGDIVCSGSNSVKATVSNFGNNQVDSVMIGWTMNGVLQTPFKYVGTLDTIEGTGAISTEVTLGNFNYLSGNTYNLSVFSYLPNNAADNSLLDDTLSVTTTVGLGGNYTIGGGGSDYGSFTAAVNDLIAKGVCDSVSFQVAAGTYVEQLSIPQIVGSNATNHIEFKGVDGDSLAVKLSFNSLNSGDNHVIKFDGVNYISFKSLTLESTNSSYDRAVLISNNSAYISFENCAIQNNAVSTPYNYFLVEVASSSNSDYLTFKNNHFLNGYSGVYSHGANADYFNISGNTFINQLYDGVYIYGANYVSVNQNYINTNSNNSFIGIELRYCDSSVSVQRNNIINAYGSGINLDYCDGSTSNQNIVANNFVHLKANSTSGEGIDIISCNNLNVLFNTVNSVSNTTSNVGLRVIGGANVQLLNNNIAVKNGLALYVGSAANVSTSNYNNFYNENGDFGYWQGDVEDIAALRIASNQDSNSMEEPPFFPVDTAYQTSQIALNNAGVSVPGLLVDIDNELRNSSTPDIGADEFTPTSLDAGVYDLIIPVMPFAEGNLPVKVLLRNFGGVTITSATLNWTINGIAQAPVNFNGSLNSGDTTSVLLGNVNFTEGSLYSVVAYSINPNGVADVIAVNDTIEKGVITPALGGDYTIGGAVPDFADFSSAASILNLGGIKDNVNFNVRSGTYNERLVFSRFLKINERDSVNFQSEALDSSLVTLSAGYINSSENYVVRLNGTEGIAFSNLKIENTSTNSYSRVLYIDSGSAYVSFENCALVAGPTTSSATSVLFVFNSENSSSEPHHISINASTLKNGYYGVFIDGRNSRGHNFRLTNSNLVGNFRNGLFLQEQDSVFVHQNNIIPREFPNSSYQGIYLYDSKMGTISSNKILAPSSPDGIYTYSIEGSNTNPYIIANNFISTGGNNSDGYGLELFRVNYVKVVHNSILSTNSNANAAAFNDDYSSFNGNNGVEVLNNVFQNTGSGYAIKVDHSFTSTIIDYNSFYATGINLGYWSTTNAQDLANWKSTSGHDANSIFGDAFFTSDTNLHVKASALNKSAFLLSYITTDIDGEMRDATNPDIGADEFMPIGDDAGLLSLQGPLKPFVPGNQNVFIRLLNNGADTLTTVNISWEVNGLAQLAFAFIGNLPSGESLDSVNIGNFNFLEDSVYSLKIYTSLPNGNADVLAANDTLQVDGIASALSGEYTIGGLSPDFGTFNEANNALKQRGISGWVRFNVRDGIYDETLLLRPVTGSVDNGDSIIFVSENQDAGLVTLRTSNSSPALVEFRGAEYVTFRDITLSTTYIFNGQGVVLIDSTSHDITLHNCVLKDTLYTTYGDILLRTGSNYVNSLIKIQNCTFENGRYAINAQGVGSNREAGLLIENSIFKNQYYRGIYFDDQEEFTIKGNKFSTDRGYGGYFAIYGNNSRNGGTISKNHILGSTDDGIYLGDVDGTALKPVIVANNYVQLIGTAFSSGINIISCNHINVVYNSVRVFNTNVSTEAFFESSCADVVVFNNIFQNEGGGYAVDMYGYNSYQQNFNNLYSSGALLARYRNSSYADLASFSATSNLDTNGVSIPSQFSDSTNIHVVAAGLNGAASPIAYVNSDYEGDFRDPTNPDIGADEFTINTNDASITAITSPSKPFATGNNQVFVSLLNNGLDTLRSVQINWTVNGIAQSAFNWVGAIGTGDQDTLSIGSFNFAVGNSHDIIASTSLPNGQVDILTTNDTAAIQDLYPGLSGVYTIGGGAADFIDFTSAIDALNAGGVLGWVNFNVNNGTYTEQLNFIEIAGASASDSVVFQSLSGDSSSVVLTFNANNTNKHTIQFNGADFISFKDLSIEGQNSNYSLLVDLTNDNRNIQFQNVSFMMPNSTNFNVRGIAGAGDIENLKISNCYFHQGYAGIFLDGISSTGLHVVFNDFNNQEYYGIYTRNFNGPRITANQIFTSNINSSFTGLYLYNLDNGSRIENNKIHIPYLGRGLYSYDMDGGIGNRGLIANNFITIGDSTASTLITKAYDIHFGSNLDIAFNTANHASSDGHAFFMASNSNSTHFQNNLAVSTGGDYAYYSTGNSALSNYNNFYSTGAFPFYHSVFGGDIADFATWKTNTSSDANSLFVDPLFVSAFDLHITQSALDSTATPLGFVPTDIDGELRDLNKPDIGADEVAVFPGDIGVAAIIAPITGCGFDINEIFTVQINNTGTQSQTGFDISLIVNTDTITETVNMSIGGGSSANYTFIQGADMSTVGIYNIKIFSSMIGDNNALNDTLLGIVNNNPPPTITLNNDTTICIGELVTLTATGGTSYDWSNGLSGSSITVGPNVTTKYYVTVTDGLSCVSTDSLTITVNTITDTTNIFLNTCDPGQAGNSTQTLINQYGCDSVINTFVTLLPTYNVPLAPLTICEGDTVLIFGVERFADGFYTDTLTTVGGCDSVLSRNLILTPIDSVSLASVTICENQNATIFGTVQNTAGVYYSTLLASTGCDSVVSQELFVNLVDTVDLGDVAICDGDSIDLFGVFQNTAGTYYNTVIASTGCDSVVFINLFINPTFNTNTTVEICEGDDILLEGSLRTMPGIYTDTLQSAEFCDSVVVTTLIVNPVDTSLSTQIVAIGDSVLIAGLYRKVSGDYPDVFPSIHNCDSVHITTLTFVPPARYFAYTGNLNYVNSLVFPETGDEYTTFNFEVSFYDTTGTLPPFGFPRMILDYEGNGQFNNNFDRTIVMTEVNPGDLNPRDGKLYQASINSLNVGMDYKILAQVIENGDEVLFGPYNNLDVLAEPDLEIFANNIVFSDPNPAVNSPLTVSATVTNTSDYQANNFVVHLVNQYDPALIYPDIVVPSLAPRSSTTVSWNITTPAVDAWCPMEVSVDFTDVILESNELDNVAIRPFINGDYNLPGSIVVHPTITPESQCSNPSNHVRVYGFAYYTGTAVPLPDSSVAGATVTITRGAATYTGLTNSNGYFSVYIPAPLVPGTYPTKVEVTDYTLTNDSVGSFDILNCPCSTPDLSSHLTLTDYSILVGQSIGGTATVTNIGCDPVIPFQISFTQTGGVPVLLNQNFPALAPGASTSYNFNNIVFNVAGTYTICVDADLARTVGENNFGNNRYCRTVRVYPALPDIQPIDGPRINRFLCEINSVGFRVANNGAVATGAFDCSIYIRKDGVAVDTLYHTIANIDAFRSISFSKAYAHPGVGLYSYTIHCDTAIAVGGIVVETNEFNNDAVYSHVILECKPDLVVSGCDNLQVNPYSPVAPGGAVIFEATVRNSGNATAFGPIDVEFQVSGGPTHTVVIGDLLPGQSVLVQTNAVATASGVSQLTVTADAANFVNNEFSEANNSITDNLCWEFKPVPRCSGSDFWNRTYNVNETAYLGVAVLTSHLYKADSLRVQFEVSGPGIVGVQNLGKALLTNVSKTCFCPPIAVLPTNFVFNEVGTYTFIMTVDPDNDYPECNDGNNVLVKQVIVNNRPDMRVLSQFIKPSLLNPDINDSIDLVISYENIGKSNVNDQMELRVLVDGVPLDSIKPVVGLVTGDNTSYAIPTRWASMIPGVHVIRAIIDSDEEISENDELNNEATRAIVVGEAANLMWANFESDDIAPSLADTLLIFGYVKNNGDVATDGDVLFSFINNNFDTIAIATVGLGNINPGDSVLASLAWNVLDNKTTLIGEIINSTELEFTYNDNVATTQIGKFNVALNAMDVCFGSNGSLKATVSGDGVAPYTFAWSNGANTDSLVAVPGTYSIDVTDATGFTVTETGVIGVLSGGLYYLPNISVCDGDSAEVFGIFRQSSGFYYDTLQTVDGCDSVLSRALIVNPIQNTTLPLLNLCGADSALVFGEYRFLSGMYSDSLISVNTGCDSIVSRQLILNPSYEIILADVIGCDSALAFGQYFTASGTYRDTLLTQAGCDSIIVVNISINNSDNTTVNVTACNSYIWAATGLNYTASNVYVDTLTNANGCDSVVTLNLIINTSDTTNQTVVACDSYTWSANATNYLLSGNYSTTLQNSDGCDSVVNLNLTINLSQRTILPAINLCGADSALIFGQYRLSSGNYFDTLTSLVTNCDSVVSRQLIINPTYETILADIVACDSALVFGQYVHLSGTYRDSLQSLLSCDSVIVVNVSINNSNVGSQNVVACNSYIWPANATNYSSSGVYTAVLTNQDNCDSTVTLNLTINSSDTTNLNVTACDNYLWTTSGVSYNSSGIYTVVLLNADGCDSVVNLNLIINSSESSSQVVVACDSYFWPISGLTYNDGGIYPIVLTNAAGCDSTVTLNLTINTSDTTNQSVVACDSYIWATNGVTYTNSGNYTSILNNTDGCDSVVNLALTINTSDTTNLNVTACDNYLWTTSGVSYNSSGTYTIVLLNADGCDSVVNLNLIINSSESSSQVVVACDSYFWPTSGLTYNDGGVYPIVLANAAGCDSTVTLNLTINTSDTTNQSVVACDSYLWPTNGVTYTNSGNYISILNNTDGCDSVVNLALTINHSDTTRLNITACDTYDWFVGNGTPSTYNSSGSYSFVLQNSNGCDSVVILDLIVSQSDAASETVVACDSYFWPASGLTYNDGGVYPVVLTNAAGCDSTVTLNLTINSSDTTNLSALACNSYFWPVNGISYTSSGNYSTTLNNSAGCDSVVNLALTINHSDTTHLSVASCDSYTWFIGGGTPSVFSSSGIHTVVLFNSDGCDSVVILDLTVNYSDASSETVVACDNFVWPTTGLTYTSSGIYTVVLTNAAGCDSTVSLDLTINNGDITNQSITACDSYFWLTNGNSYTASGNYSTTLTNANGCDSVVNLALTINHSDTTHLSVTSCNSYTWFVGGVTPTTYSSSGIHTATLLNSQGCDSVVILDLIINYSNFGSQTIAACDNYVWPATGLSYATSGTYTTTLTNIYGCDSVLDLILTINTSDSTTTSISACDSYFWAENGMTYNSTGNYSVTLINSNGCDSVIVLDLSISNGFNSNITETACKSYTWPFNGQVYTQSGTYRDTLMAANGCDSIMNLILTIDTVNTAVSQNGITLTAQNPIATSLFQWVYCDSGMVAVFGANNAVFTPTANGSYAVIIDQNGCVDTSDCIIINNVGLFEKHLLHSIKLYPNPTSSGKFNLDFGVYYDEVEISIKDVSGKVLEVYQLENVNGFEGYIHGAKGLYFADIKVKDVGYLVRKLVKQ